MNSFKKTTEEIREEADLLLRATLGNVFNSMDTRLSVADQNTQTDRGIDFIYEVIDRKSDKTKLRFNAQNKGADKTSVLKILKSDRTGPAGFISYKIEKFAIFHITFRR